MRRLQWEEAIEMAKEELGIDGYTDDWDSVVELAKEFQRKQERKLKKIYNEYMQSEKWKEVRRKVFERDKYLCVNCLENGNCETYPTECHHESYKYFGRGDELEINHCISLCHECHQIITKLQKEEYENKYEAIANEELRW